MKRVYIDALEKLIDLVTQSRDLIVNNHDKFEQSLGDMIYLGDKKFGVYHSMVETNEYRATKVIESIAVELFSELGCSTFGLYPVEPKYARLSEDEQKKSRPFQIVLSENNLRCGVVFSNLSDIGEYIRKFENGNYDVDTLKVVVIASPNDETRESLFTVVNKMNKSAGIAIERIPLLDFWAKYFGEDECAELCQFCEEYNSKAKEILGFNTVVIPTEKAIEQFRIRCGEIIKNQDYVSDVPDTIYANQVSIIRKNYLDKGRWKVMIGRSNFAISFITSEWFYTMYQLTENLDLTSIVAGYLKSIEQLLFALIQLYEGTGITIKSKGKDIVQFNEENNDIIDTTLGALEQVVKHNSKLLDVNRYAKDYLVETIDDWRNKQRNGYFHKHNLHSLEKVREIRDKALHMYFLILGSFSISDEQIKGLERNI